MVTWVVSHSPDDASRGLISSQKNGLILLKRFEIIETKPEPRFGLQKDFGSRHLESMRQLAFFFGLVNFDSNQNWLKINPEDKVVKKSFLWKSSPTFCSYRGASWTKRTTAAMIIIDHVMDFCNVTISNLKKSIWMQHLDFANTHFYDF